jgi:hypothetical protein
MSLKEPQVSLLEHELVRTTRDSFLIFFFKLNMASDFFYVRVYEEKHRQWHELKLGFLFWDYLFFCKEAKERRKLKGKTIHEERRFPMHHSKQDRGCHMEEKHESRSQHLMRLRV